jgi:hypothetical protein
MMTSRSQAPKLSALIAASVCSHRRCLVLVGDVELHGACSCEKVLVIVQQPASTIGREFTASVVHDNDVAHGRERVDQRPQQSEKRLVDEDDFVLGMVDDVGDLFGEQADVERVEYSPATWRGEVQLKMAGAVPCERRHPPVGTDPEIV